MKILLASLRIVLVIVVVCCVGYPLLVLGIAGIAASDSAAGSLVRNSRGQIVGSRLIAQSFSEPRYFWPRPSAVNYDGAAAGGSNLSSTSERITERADEIIARFGATGGHPIPADLVTASGSGLDPHISLAAAEFQVPRVATARGIPERRVIEEIHRTTAPAGGMFAPDPLVNVLELNLALDRMSREP